VRLVETAEQLQRRVAERFPESGLAQVCGEVAATMRSVEQVRAEIAREHWGLRSLVALFVTLLCAAVLGLGWSFVSTLRAGFEDWSELLQGLEAGVNDLVFLGIAIWYLWQLEPRRKRRKALQSLHRLRALAHIIDMHQLTKDPEMVTRSRQDATASSPRRSMTPFELVRYLDYCSEALALLSKAAALQVQSFDDRETLAAVGDIEDLTDGLARKIWQKITILDRVLQRDDALEPPRRGTLP
jgi:hypothetical protein